jgi:hypothetical protein
MPRPSHPPWFYLPNGIWWRVHVMNLESAVTSWNYLSWDIGPGYLWSNVA